MPKEVISKVNSIIYEFIWGGKTDKVKRDTFEQNFERGGYKMVNIKDMITASSVNWIKKYLDNVDRDWKFTFEALSNQSNLNLCLQSNYDIKELDINLPKYYLNSLTNWFNLKHTSISENDDKYLKPAYIWYNKNIKIASKCIYSSHLFTIGMWTIDDLFSNNVIVPFETWKARGARELDRLLWLGIIKQVQNVRTNVTIGNESPDPIPCGIVLKSNFISVENITQKHIKEILTDIKYNSFKCSNQKYKIKYNNILGPIAEEEWEKVFLTVRTLPLDNKTKDLQYKIVMRFVATNYLLYKMNKVASQNCSFCAMMPETIEHLFFECTQIKNIWLYIFDKVNQLSNNRFLCTLKLCLLGMYDKKNVNRDVCLVVNTIIVLVKAYIMTCKYNETTVSIHSLIQYMRMKCDMLSFLNNSVFRSISDSIIGET